LAERSVHLSDGRFGEAKWLARLRNGVAGEDCYGSEE
jgi:hypothetical protein